MKSLILSVSGPPVIGVTCRQGHFEERRRRIASPLFIVGMITIGVIVDFIWALPADGASYYLPIILLNIVGAWLTVVAIVIVREKAFPLPTLCPICEAPLDQFRGTVDPKAGPNEVEVASIIAFIFLHVTIITIL